MQETTVEASASAPQTIRGNVSTRRLILILVGVMLGMLTAAINQTVVGTAMPRIVAELQGLEHYAWVFTAFMLTSTVSVPIYGKLSDVYGRRPFFILGIAIFLVGSALSGLSQDMTQLIIFRGIQGLGAGAMMPIAVALIGDIFPPAERGKWQGLMMAVFGLATIVGPTLGGWLTDNWGWRWVFYVNMPVGILALVTAGFALPKQTQRQDHAIDYAGAATLIAGTVPLLLAFSWAGTQYAWGSSQIIGLFIVAAVMLTVFYFIERRAEEPVLNPRLFGNSIFSVSVVATFLTSIGMFGAIMYLPLFIQGVIGTSATNSGAVLTPMMLGFMVSSVVGGQIMSRTGRYKVLALGGFVVAAIGMFLLTRMTVNATNGLVVRNMVITGLGIGVMMSLFTIVVQNAFPFRQLGEVTSSLQFFRSIGGTIGVGVLGSVMTNRFTSALETNIPDTVRQLMPAGGLSTVANPQALFSPEATARIRDTFASMGPQGMDLFNQFMTAVRESLTTGIVGVFQVSLGVMIVAFIVTLFLREIPLRKAYHDEPSEPSSVPGGQAAGVPGASASQVMAPSNED